MTNEEREAIRQRSEERRTRWGVDDGGCEGAAAEYLNEAADDIDVLLAEVADLWRVVGNQAKTIDRLLVGIEARDAMIAAWEKVMAWEKQHPSGGPPCEVCARLGPKEHVAT